MGGGYYDPVTTRCGGNCQDVRCFNSGGRMRLIALAAELVLDEKRIALRRRSRARDIPRAMERDGDEPN
ncbi:hypothetical protein [Paraburkholderia terrae]|uniref:hypothetical protein n=1 Tax=Paraburkholderia terrae TaxID=311230 RepID=UPI0020593C21|nr:hypothetical protein [Paraburkholderia terrae]BDC39200.1 hypothetical protein PTKU15_24970 [Paraburkholderia terrae]